VYPVPSPFLPPRSTEGDAQFNNKNCGIKHQNHTQPMAVSVVLLMMDANITRNM
jgi:hypothetical protein